jgi:hypothetical protein
MTEPAYTLDDDFDDAPDMTVEDYLEIIDDAVDEALDGLMENEDGLMRLAAFLKRKAKEVADLAAEVEPTEIDEEEAE